MQLGDSANCSLKMPQGSHQHGKTQDPRRVLQSQSHLQFLPVSQLFVNKISCHGVTCNLWQQKRQSIVAVLLCRVTCLADLLAGQITEDGLHVITFLKGNDSLSVSQRSVTLVIYFGNFTFFSSILAVRNSESENLISQLRQEVFHDTNPEL